jgi:iron complex transport system substrate-binding protein
MSDYRIVSLLPSATEIVHFLGLTDYLVGRSHECDFPESVKRLPICTAPKFHPQGDSLTIHQRVSEILERALSVYEVKIELLQELQPTHIITQAQCEVCAVSMADVEIAVRDFLSPDTQIISLQPNFLHEVWSDIARVGEMLGVEHENLIAGLQERVEIVKAIGDRAKHRPRTVCIEWIEPLMSAGNWIPELVEIAGGVNLFGIAGKHSPWLQWEELLTSNPEVIIFMPCGFDLDKTAMEVHRVWSNPLWQKLSAVCHNQVYLTDGNSYFNRPGPRLVESLEILQEILHPVLVDSKHYQTGWCKYYG